jgi:hypothetical protein
MKYLGGKIFLVLGVLLCSGFFISKNCLAAEAGAVIINEVAWMGSSASANAEWLELKNPGSAPIDLSGWVLSAADGQPKIYLSGTIPDGGYFLLERTSDETVPGLPADQIYTGALGNVGEILELKDDLENLIDRLDASAGWPAGDNELKQTMERKTDGSWQNSLAAGGTPKAVNGGGQPETEVEVETETAPISGGDSGSNNRGAVYGDVVINEFLSDPETGQEEWVELYNPGGGELSLDGWTIADGAGTETVLAGGFTEDNYYFYVIAKPKGALNNAGDTLVLYSDAHNLIDKIVYGKYGDQPDNNAPAPAKNESAALRIDGKKSLFDKDSFALTVSPTRGKPNIISAPESGGDSEAETAAAGNIFITEIFPNPFGSDRESEFIELYNSSGEEIDLSGWRLEIEAGRIFEFGKFFNQSRKLEAGGYFALYRAESNLVLDNNGGRIRLFAPRKARAAQLLEYGEAFEGLSFCDTEKIDLKNIGSSTKTFLNNTLGLNRWVWSEASTPGRSNQIKTANHLPVASFFAPAKAETGLPINFDASDSFDEDGQALSFAWDFGDGVRLDLETPAHIFLRPGSYSVKLEVGDGREISILEKTIKVGGADFSHSAAAPLNKVPIVWEEPPLKKSAPQKIVSQEKKNTEAKAAAEKSAALPAANPITRTRLGAARKIFGAVIVLPGTYGSQYFYVLEKIGLPAEKIYSYYKNFPSLVLGDLVEVSGVVGGSEADKYLKIKSAGDIIIFGRAEVSAPEKVTAAGFKEENLGKFVRAEGEVESKNGAQVALNDGGGKINLYLKDSAEIDIKKIKAGQIITATGLLGRSSEGLAILPRGEFDLLIATSSAVDEGEVLGIATGGGDWVLPARKSASRPLIYGSISAVGAVAALIGYIIARRRP